jgi:hypothetical protein
MTPYWPAWFAALALAAVAVAYWRWLRKPLGVSGHWERTVAGLCELPAAANSPGAAQDGLSFFLGVFLGGVAAAAVKGGWALRTELSPLFTRTFGAGPMGWVVLFVGGVMVGYGTRWADGCTSGHGLMGTSCRQKGSFAATAIFFGTAVAVAFALKAWRP